LTAWWYRFRRSAIFPAVVERSGSFTISPIAVLAVSDQPYRRPIPMLLQVSADIAVY